MSDRGFSPAARKRARRMALQALYQWQLAGATLRSIELEFRQDNDMSKIDSQYFGVLLHQVPAHLTELDEVLTPLLDRALDVLTPIELAVLRIGAYELLYRPDIPYRVAINEAVDLAKKFGATDGHKFVNGVLDRVAKTHRTSELPVG